MSFRIPRTFQIKDKTWTVSYESGLEDDGETDQVARTIKIRKEIPRSEKVETFIHEFIHAALFEIHLSGPANVLSDDVEEIICTGLADVLVSTFVLDWQTGKARGGRR